MKNIPNTNRTTDNYIFGGNNFIFEGRSFDDDQVSLLIGYIPENTTIPLNDTKLEELLTYAVNLGKLDKNYTIYNQCLVTHIKKPDDNNSKHISEKQ